MVNVRGGRGLSADDPAAEQRLKEEKEMSKKQKLAEVKARTKEKEDEGREAKRQAKKIGQAEKRKRKI